MSEQTKTPQSTKTVIVEAIDHLSPKYLDDVWQFIQFLELKATMTPDDTSEDEALWDTVLANQVYKQQYTDEEIERYESGDDFLKATTDW